MRERGGLPDDAGRISRRTFLLAGCAVAAGVGGGTFAVPGARRQLRQLLRSEAQSSRRVPTGPAGPVVTASLDSRAMGRSVGWSIAYPAGISVGAALPMLLVLHGRGDDHRDVLGSHRLGEYLTDAVRSGATPFAIVGVDGGDHSYWHRRASGEDPPRMILEELLPTLARRGLHTKRFAVGGWSMGGYGALLLTQRLGTARIAACAVDSPALWTRAGDTSPGAFDGKSDFEANNVIARREQLRGVPIRVACGTSDPFLPGVKKLLSLLPEALSDVRAGGHNTAFWRSSAPAQLAFVAEHLGLP